MPELECISLITKRPQPKWKHERSSAYTLPRLRCARAYEMNNKLFENSFFRSLFAPRSLLRIYLSIFSPCFLVLCCPFVTFCLREQTSIQFICWCNCYESISQFLEVEVSNRAAHLPFAVCYAMYAFSLSSYLTLNHRLNWFPFIFACNQDRWESSFLLCFCAVTRSNFRYPSYRVCEVPANIPTATTANRYQLHVATSTAQMKCSQATS